MTSEPCSAEARSCPSYEPPDAAEGDSPQKSIAAGASHEAATLFFPCLPILGRCRPFGLRELRPPRPHPHSATRRRRAPHPPWHTQHLDGPLAIEAAPSDDMSFRGLSLGAARAMRRCQPHTERHTHSRSVRTLHQLQSALALRVSRRDQSGNGSRIYPEDAPPPPTATVLGPREAAPNGCG